MTAGLNLRGKLIRITDQADDDIGGAQPSGTVLYPLVFARIRARRPTQALLEQGLETPTIFTAVLEPGDMDIQPNDQFEVTFPQEPFYYGKRFIIIGIQRDSMTDVRNFIVVTMRRFEKAHSNLLQ